MKVLGALLVAAEITLFSLSLAAQESLPDSYLQKLATIDRLKKLTLTDLARDVPCAIGRTGGPVSVGAGLRSGSNRAPRRGHGAAVDA
jgi:hypothetical protein